LDFKKVHCACGVGLVASGGSTYVSLSLINIIHITTVSLLDYFFQHKKQQQQQQQQQQY